MSHDIRSLIDLLESMLLEAALSKGSQSIIKNIDMVGKIAARVRRDSRMNISDFPPGFAAKAAKMSDEEVANWFLESIDQIEKTGYGGVVYSRDGTNNLWIATKYAIGAHSWNDLKEKLALTLSQFYFLKNRNLLEPGHRDIPAFKSIRELGEYIVFHYAEQIKEFEDKLRSSGMKKAVRAFLVVDNDDYRVFATLNRAANLVMGQGATWCTSMVDTDSYFNSYSKAAMIFQIYPYEPREVEIDKGPRVIRGKERYQFDAGGPYFMNIADLPENKTYVRETFPYLYDDLVKNLSAKAGEISEYIKTNQEDPSLQDPSLSLVKSYDIPTEIRKLQKFITAGWMTDTPRPAETPDLPAPNA
jgi:hypothetical protein